MDGIDPEFLAALPPEMQAEVLEQQRLDRRRRAAAARREAALAVRRGLVRACEGCSACSGEGALFPRSMGWVGQAQWSHRRLGSSRRAAYRTVPLG